MMVLFWIVEFYIIYFKLYLIETYLLGYAHKIKWKVHFLGLIYLVIAIIIIKPDTPTYTFIQRSVTVLPIIILYKELRGKNRILSLIMVTVGITTYELLVSVLAYGVFNVSISELAESYRGALLLNSIGYTGFLLAFIIKKWGKKYDFKWFQRIELSSLWGLIVAFTALMFYITPVLVLDVNNGAHKLIILYFISGLVVTLMVISIVYRLYKVNEKRLYYETMTKMSEAIMEEQEEYYKSLYERDQEIRKFRHDFNSHLSILAYLNQSKDYTGLGEYIEEMKQEIGRLEAHYQTGNDLVNMVVSETIGRKIQPGVSFTWQGLLPSKLAISQMKVCTIFSNILNNAIEATAKDNKTKDKWIKVKVWNEADHLFITVENSVEQKVKVVNNRLMTTKVDAKNHGFGSQNVEKAVLENKGKLEYETEEESFKVKIELPNAIA